MHAARHAIHTAIKSTVEAVTPARSESAFKTQGVLTPEEFVVSGDHLVRTCPTWSWEGGDPAKAKSFLPKDKQYLVTRNVPSSKRASAVEGYGTPGAADEFLEGEEGEEAWVAPPAQHENATHEGEPTPSLPASKPEAAAGERREGGAGAGEVAGSKGAEGKEGEEGGEDDDDIPDLDDLELEEEEEDEAALPAPSAARVPPGGEGEEEEDGVLRVRTYDILITYDKFYQVPRSWLMGYDESRQPLKPDQILEDVTEEHARKTVTVDPFPHSSLTALSIHPCKHASLMKKLGSMAEASGKPFTVDAYLVLFLKFLASIIPTVEYDYTMAAGW